MGSAMAGVISRLPLIVRLSLEGLVPPALNTPPAQDSHSSNHLCQASQSFSVAGDPRNLLEQKLSSSSLAWLPQTRGYRLSVVKPWGACMCISAHQSLGLLCIDHTVHMPDLSRLSGVADHYHSFQSRWLKHRRASVIIFPAILRLECHCRKSRVNQAGCHAPAMDMARASSCSWPPAAASRQPSSAVVHVSAALAWSFEPP